MADDDDAAVDGENGRMMNYWKKLQQQIQIRKTAEVYRRRNAATVASWRTDWLGLSERIAEEDKKILRYRSAFALTTTCVVLQPQIALLLLPRQQISFYNYY